MELVLNKDKFDTFLEVSRLLNKKLDIIPVLYGSLGLNRAIGEFGGVNDADVLIPDPFINERWSETFDLMKSVGFELKDLKEHEFTKNGNIIAFAGESDLSKLTGVRGEDLNTVEVNGAKFKELSPEQYLVLYQALSQDSYRQKQKGEADKKRIILIQEYLENQK